jgi:hypothetical protein
MRSVCGRWRHWRKTVRVLYAGIYDVEELCMYPMIVNRVQEVLGYRVDEPESRTVIVSEIEKLLPQLTTTTIHP